MSVSLGELAVRFGCELRGDPATQIERVATLAEAESGAIAFLANPLYRPQLAHTRAGAVLLEAAAADSCPVAALIAENPYATYARVAALLHPQPRATPGIHPSAVVAPDARIDPTAHVGALSVVEARAVIGPRCFIGPQCMVGADATLDEDVHLVARVTLAHGVRLSARVLIHPGVVVGGDGFGFAPERRVWIKVPQLGSVRIGPDVEIGANTTIDRGAIADTVIEEGVKLDNQIQIGHNVHIGAHTAIAGCVGIAGSSTIGRRCMIGGCTGVGGHISICDDTVITGFTMVTHSITRPGVYSSGIPFEEAGKWRRMVARFKRIDALMARLVAVERKTGIRGSAGRSEDDD